MLTTLLCTAIFNFMLTYESTKDQKMLFCHQKHLNATEGFFAGNRDELMFVGLMPEMHNTECKVQNVSGLSLRGAWRQLAMRRGNLLVQSIKKLCKNKHRTGRFPRRGFAPPRNDIFDGAVQLPDKL